MSTPTNAEMLDQFERGELDEYTKCNVGLIAALMHFGLPEATQYELYHKMRLALDEHPDHAETVNKILRIGMWGLCEHGILAARPEGEYTVTLQLNVEGYAPYGTVVRVGYPRVSKRGEQPPRTGKRRTGKRGGRR